MGSRAGKDPRRGACSVACKGSTGQVGTLMAMLHQQRKRTNPPVAPRLPASAQPTVVPPRQGSRLHATGRAGSSTGLGRRSRRERGGKGRCLQAAAAGGRRHPDVLLVAPRSPAEASHMFQSSASCRRGLPSGHSPPPLILPPRQPCSVAEELAGAVLMFDKARMRRNDGPTGLGLCSAPEDGPGRPVG